jgi:DNA-binding SARP family transcriptional activator
VLPAELRFELLGAVRAWHRDAELDLGSPQQRGVLAVLLLARGRQVSVQALIDALWGDRPPRSAVSTVRTYILRLRRCLDLVAVRAGDEAIRLVGDGYSLQPGAAVLDLALFEERVRDARAARDEQDSARAAGLFRDALALWQGMPLAGIAGPYARAQRARLAELHAAAAEDSLAADIDSGAHQDAVAELRILHDSDPMREKLTELLMLALYRSGRQADALAVFDDSRRVLRDELGIDPGPALRQMHQRILQTDTRLTRPAAPSASRPEAPVPALLPPDRG